MPDNPYSLAIDMSGRRGSVTLGHGEKVLETITLADPRQPPRHQIDLIPSINALCQRHDMQAKQLGQVFISVGPGSFTGLRISIATAKTLGRVLGTKLVAVETMDAVAHHVWASHPDIAQLAVCLNIKQDTVYVGVYHLELDGYALVSQPTVELLSQFLQRAPRPLTIVSDPSLRVNACQDPRISHIVLDPDTQLSDPVWHLGVGAAKRGRFVDPLQLLPLYVRPPEAEELWRQRHRQAPV